MKLDQTLAKLIRTVIKKEMISVVTVGVVKSIDKDNNTCNVERDGLPDLLDVRLNAVLEAGAEVVTIYPTVGSNVLCCCIENNTADAYVLACTKIEEIIINGGENGGLCITPKLVEQLGKTNELLEAILDTINGVQITEPGNGAPSALQAALATAIAGKSVGVYNEVENVKIKH